MRRYKVSSSFVSMASIIISQTELYDMSTLDAELLTDLQEHLDGNRDVILDEHGTQHHKRRSRPQKMSQIDLLQPELLL